MPVVEQRLPTEQPRPRIISPRPSSRVPHRERVTVAMPPEVGPRVFLFVTGGGQWYGQQHPERTNDGVWEAECVFGNYDSYAASFNIVAIAMDVPPYEPGPFKELPVGTTSDSTPKSFPDVE